MERRKGTVASAPPQTHEDPGREATGVLDRVDVSHGVLALQMPSVRSRAVLAHSGVGVVDEDAAAAGGLRRLARVLAALSLVASGVGVEAGGRDCVHDVDLAAITDGAEALRGAAPHGARLPTPRTSMVTPELGHIHGLVRAGGLASAGKPA